LVANFFNYDSIYYPLKTEEVHYTIQLFHVFLMENIKVLIVMLVLESNLNF